MKRGQYEAPYLGTAVAAVEGVPTIVTYGTPVWEKLIISFFGSFAFSSA